MYADDTLILASNNTDTKIYMQCIEQARRMYGLQLNWNCLNAGRTHVLFLMLKTASVMRRYRMNLVHFSIVHDQSHSPFLDGVSAKNPCYAQGCHDPMTSYEPSLSSTCALSTCWLLDEAVFRFIFKKV